MVGFIGAVLGGAGGLIIYLLKYVAAAAIFLIAGIGGGVLFPIVSLIGSVSKHINPYKTYQDKHTNIASGKKRNYFFGPGFHQILEIDRGAFLNLSKNKDDFINFEPIANFFGEDPVVDVFMAAANGIFFLLSWLLGFILVGFFSVVMSAAVAVGTVVNFFYISIFWLADRLALILKSIHSRCPNCKSKYVIPGFQCPHCGQIHEKLIPGPYGVIKFKCQCGTKLPTTFIGGRSKYKAFCPKCHQELSSSNSQQYGIQLVGWTTAGKTTFLAAFWHEYQEWMKNRQDVSLKGDPAHDFMDLESLFDTGISSATPDQNAKMYSIFHYIQKKTPVQMAIYDIAGEAFGSQFDQQQMLKQRQFSYCEGFLFVIDPASTPNDVSDGLSNFISSMEEEKGKSSEKTVAVPAAILITKGDLYKKEIGFPHIKATYKNVLSANSEVPLTLEQHQDDVCRTFLIKNGFGNAVNLLEAKFSNIRYFPVSAMGHAETRQFEPWGVLEPVFWLMNHDKCPLRGIIQQK